MAEVTIDSALM